MITLSPDNQLKGLWNIIKENNIIPETIKQETEQKVLRNKLEVRVDYTNCHIGKEDLQDRLNKNNRAIALVEPLIKEVATRLNNDSKLLVADTNGVIIASHIEDIIGYSCPAAELVNSNHKLRKMVDKGTAIEVRYDNGIHSQLLPIFNEHGQLQFLCGISDHQPISKEASILLYMATQMIQQRYAHIMIVDEYTRFLMNAISHYAILLDEYGQILNVNEQVLDLLDISDNSMLQGMPFKRLLASNPDDKYAACNHNNQYFTIQLMDKNIPCQIVRQQSIQTPYGDYTILLFNLFEYYSNSRLNDIIFPLPGDPFDIIIGTSPEIQKLKAAAKRVAGFSTTVLIEGESGTGKELLAKAIHFQSKRSGEFVTINCGAIPAQLIHSELFGYEEGAFTGAKKKGNPGKLELADGGTIFLDEIGEMPLDMQVSLLRFLQDKKVTRLGSNVSKQVDVRVIAATNRHLKDEVQKGNFREDLYYRLNVAYFRIPPLRERRQDIPILVKHFLDKLCMQHDLTVPVINQETMKSLMKYNWPGNIRELENTIERALVMSSPEELFFDMFTGSSAAGKEVEVLSISELEKESIEKYLDLYQGNISHTANALGITRQTLYRKIKSMNINRRSYT